MSFTLRPYQDYAVERAWAAVKGGARPCIVSPTGSGKTVCAGRLAADARDEGMTVAFLAPRRELVNQTVETIQAFGIQPGILMGSDTCNRLAPVQVVCWHTLLRRKSSSYPLADLLILDEVHLALSAKMIERVIPHYEDSYIVGFTATPARRTGAGLGDYFTTLVQIATVPQLITEGFLVGGDYYGGTMPDMAKVKTVMGDYSEKQTADRVNDATLIGDVVANWLRLAGDRHTIVFGVDIRHAHALAERFAAAGVAVAAVSQSTPQQERDEIIERFRRREIQVLCNCMIAAYGFDVPTVDCIVLARPTKSIVLHLQMIGRGLRPADGKQRCMVLDHAGNVTRLGMAEDDFSWSLDPGRKVQEARQFEKGERKDKPVVCGHCNHLFRRSPVCPKCGWQIPAPKKDVKHVDAELQKITRQQEIQEWIDKKQFYLELRYLEREARELDKPWHPKRAACLYREKFDQWPAWKWEPLEPAEASDKTRRWVKSRAIAFARRRGRATATVPVDARATGTGVR